MKHEILPVIWRPAVVVPVVVVGLLGARIVAPEIGDSTWRLVVALVALPAVAYVVLAQLRWHRLMDEMYQRVYLEIYAISLGMVVIVTWTLNVLQKAGFLSSVEFFDSVGLGLILGAGIGAVTSRRRLA